MRLQCGCLRRCLPEHVKIDREDVYELVGINKLHQQAKVHILKLMYKRAHNDMYVAQEDIRTRLHDAPVRFVPFRNNETYKKSVVFRGSNAWNDLTPEDCNIPTFEGFKSMLKLKLKENSS